MRAANTVVIPAKAGIQYAIAVRLEPRSRGVLDRPVKPGDDGGVWGERQAAGWELLTLRSALFARVAKG